MNFEFSEEQNLLREQARGFLQDNCSPKVVRAALEANGPSTASCGAKSLRWAGPPPSSQKSMTVLV